MSLQSQLSYRIHLFHYQHGNKHTQMFEVILLHL